MNGRIIRQLKGFAKDLPEIPEKCIKIVNGEVLLTKDKEMVDAKSNPIRAAKKYQQEVVKVVDHMKNIKSLYKTGGIQAVGNYVTQVQDFYIENVIN